MNTTRAAEQTPIEYAAKERQLVWGRLRKVSFRFLFCYVFLLCVFCVNLSGVAVTYFVTGRFPTSPLDRFWGAVVPLVARYIFYLRGLRFQAITSGDSLSEYLQFATYALISLLATVVWSMIDRKRTSYSKLNQWLRLFAQFVLSITMLLYGFDKVIPLQFGVLTPSRLLSRVGDLTPFSMLWTFMAASKPYTIFSGILEVLAGVMLVIPKLRAVGALLAVTVMTNVFLLNVFYDVPVKSFSFQLLLLAIYLASPEFPRLVKVLVLNRTVEPRSETPLASSKRAIKWAGVVQAGLAGCFFVLMLTGATHRYATRQAAANNVPLSGIWEVDEFKVANPQQPLFTSKLATALHLQPGHDRWIKLIIEQAGSAVIQLEDGALDRATQDVFLPVGSSVYVNMALSKDHRQLDITDSEDPKWKAHFAIRQPAKNLLTLQGVVNNVPVEIRLHARERAFRLNSGKYHIVNR